MKQWIIALAAAWISLPVTGQKITDGDMKKMAADLCDCVMPKMNKLHPRLQRLLETTATKGDSIARAEFQQWIDTVSEAEKNRVMEDAEYLSEGFGEDLDKCSDELAAKYPQMDQTKDGSETAKKFLKAVEDRKGCRLLYIILSQGAGKKED